MEKIVYFRTKIDGYDALRFVKSYRKGGLFKRERISYTFNPVLALNVDCKDDMVNIENRIVSDYNEARPVWITRDEFRNSYGKNCFWAITKRNEDGEPVEFYKGDDGKGNALFTGDVREALLCMDEQTQAQTISRLRVSRLDCGSAVAMDFIFANVTNNLLNPNFMIIAVDKGLQASNPSYNADYFCGFNDKDEVMLSDKSNDALRMSYASAICVYKTLCDRYKAAFRFAVLPAFNNNVHSSDIENYMKLHKISRNVVLDITLSKLIRKPSNSLRS